MFNHKSGIQGTRRALQQPAEIQCRRCSKPTCTFKKSSRLSFLQLKMIVNLPSELGSVQSTYSPQFHLCTSSKTSSGNTPPGNIFHSNISSQATTNSSFSITHVNFSVIFSGDYMYLLAATCQPTTPTSGFHPFPLKNLKLSVSLSNTLLDTTLISKSRCSVKNQDSTPQNECCHPPFFHT